jgi:hypothetical protein
MTPEEIQYIIINKETLPDPFLAPTVTNESTLDESLLMDPLVNEENRTPSERQPRCKNCPDQILVEIAQDFFECPVCQFVDF